MQRHRRPACRRASRRRGACRPRRRKGPKPGLGLERIVEAAVEHRRRARASAAVSMSRVATELGSSAMSLYRYVAAKDELLALMVDAASGPAAPAPPRARAGGRAWRGGRGPTTTSCGAHPWVLRVPISGPADDAEPGRLDGGRPAALRDTGLAEGEKLSVILLVSGYVRNEAILTADLEANFLKRRRSRRTLRCSATREAARATDGRRALPGAARGPRRRRLRRRRRPRRRVSVRPRAGSSTASTCSCGGGARPGSAGSPPPPSPGMSSRRSASTRPPCSEDAPGDLVDDAVVGRVVVVVEGDAPSPRRRSRGRRRRCRPCSGVDHAEGRRAGDVGEVRRAAALRCRRVEAVGGARRARRRRASRGSARARRGQLGGGARLGVARGWPRRPGADTVHGAVDRVQRLRRRQDQRQRARSGAAAARSTWRAYWRIRTFWPSRALDPPSAGRSRRRLADRAREVASAGRRPRPRARHVGGDLDQRAPSPGRAPGPRRPAGR